MIGEEREINVRGEWRKREIGKYGPEGRELVKRKKKRRWMSYTYMAPMIGVE